MRKYMSRSKQIIYLCNITMKLHFNLAPNDYFWSPYGEVVAIALHKYKGTPFISNCWDMVLKLSAGKSLSATPFFDLCGFKVMASWPRSEKACPRCKQAGHDSHTCPRHPASKASKKRTPAP